MFTCVHFVNHSVAYTKSAAQLFCSISVCPLSVQVHPGLFAAGAPWLTGAAYKDTLAHYSNTAVPCTYVRDKGEGRVTIDKQGYPRVHYQISPFDQKSLWKVITCFCILNAGFGSATLRQDCVTCKLVTNCMSCKLICG